MLLARKMTDLLPILDRFIAHWTALDASSGPRVLTGAFGLASLTTLRDKIAQAFNGDEVMENRFTIATADRDQRLSELSRRLLQFRAAVLSQLPGSTYIRSLPKALPAKTALDKHLAGFDAMRNLWSKINANVPPVPDFTPPLLLAGGYSLAKFEADLANLRTARDAVAAARQNRQQARASRDFLLKLARERLVQYRLAVVGWLEPTDPLLSSLPRLTPAYVPRPKPEPPSEE